MEMGRNGTSAILIVEDIKRLFDKVRTELRRIVRNYPDVLQQVLRLLDKLEREVVERSVDYYHASSVLQEFERTLTEFMTKGSNHFGDMGWLEVEVDRILPPGSAEAPFLEERDERGSSVLARLRDLVSGKRGF